MADNADESEEGGALAAHPDEGSQARKRPRPSADVGDTGEPAREHEADDGGMCYKPHIRLRDDDVAVYHLFNDVLML
jgi:hypothetical protein